VFVRSASTWTEEDKLLAADSASDDEFGRSVSLSADGSRALVGAHGPDSDGTLDDSGAAYVFALWATGGTPCSDGSECLSAFCVDGLCCDSLCDGGCEACDASGSEGSCTPLAAGSDCRASAGECDAAEVCDGASGTCPDDAAEPDGTACSDGVCQSGSCEPQGNGGSGGTPSAGGSGGSDGATLPQQDGGCGCRIAGEPPADDRAGWLALVGLALVGARRRRRPGVVR
jgi:MYXO-CTERM domain-containing protein